MKRLVLLLACSALGCHDPLAVDGEVATPGARAQVILDETSWAGGHGTRSIISVDSATGAYTRLDSTLNLPPAQTVAVTARADSMMLRLLFEKAASKEFRSAPASYMARTNPAIIEPDGYSGTLTITANQRTRRIQWSRGGPQMPAAVGAVVCFVRVATGGFIYCLPD